MSTKQQAAAPTREELLGRAWELLPKLRERASKADKLTWTCGGPVTSELDLRPCSAMGVEPDARRYKCESCDAMAVYGAEEVLVMVAI